MKTPIAQFIIVLLFLAGTYVRAAHDPYVSGARYISMSSSGVISYDLWSVCNNQAGLGFIKKPTAGFFIENRFMLPSLSLKAAAVALPLRGGSLGFSAGHFGYSAYSESSGGIGFGKTFGQRMAAGFRASYCLTRIADDYGNASAITIEGGIITALTEKLTLGVHVYNPVKTHLTKNSEVMIPMVFKAGCLLKISEKLTTVAGIEKISSQKPAFQTGFEYEAAKQFFIRGGIATQKALFSFGAGMTWKCLEFDFSSTYHQHLGYSPQISVIYEICK